MFRRALLLAHAACLVSACSSSSDAPTTTAPDGGGATDASRLPDGAPPRVEACANPNPLRGTKSGLSEFVETVQGGDFEGSGELIASPETSGGMAPTIEKRESSAHGGRFGYRVTASAKGYVEMASHVDKGDTNEFSVWVRSPAAEQTLRLAFRVESTKAGSTTFEPVFGNATKVGSTWTELTLSYGSKEPVADARIGVEVPAGAVIDVDDFSAKAAWFKRVSYTTGAKSIGGIQVPDPVKAPTHLAVLIHIEDPQNLVPGTQYFQQKTTVFEALAKVLKAHKGVLTIQPEREWALGADASAKANGGKNVLARLAEEYGVEYSTHTHGPVCVDSDGKPHNGTECMAGPDSWKANPITPSAVAQYVQERKALFESMSGKKVTDNNGNFDTVDWSALAGVGIQTMSAYKNKNTQLMLQEQFNNPWRPSKVDGLTDQKGFETHDKSGALVYVPGIGQSVPKYHPFIPENVSRALSQYLSWADPFRVNTFYIVLHVDNYVSKSGLTLTDYLSSPEFQSDVGAVDTLLGNVVDPLVASGHLKWATIPEMAQAYTQWESQCAQGKP